MIIKRRGNILIASIVILLIMTGCTTTEVLPNKGALNNNANENLEVHFINVGQADSILIKLPNGTTSLIDGGNRADSELVKDYIKRLGITKIDYLIATHPHEDHIGGLPEVIKSFDIGNIYMPKKSATTKIFEGLVTEVKNKGLKAIEGKAGVEIINEEGIKFSIIAPNSTEYSETNEYSIVTKLEYKDTSFIFTGDAEQISEKEMIEKGFNLYADVLKVGHHGGRTSTIESFLRKVDPKYAVISVEKGNDYGHPHKETVERLNNMGINILRTDEMGTIIFVSDGKKLSINGETITENKKENNIEQNTEQYIGNINSKIYHSKDCNSLPKEENRTIFSSISDAKKAGYEPHKICIKN